MKFLAKDKEACQGVKVDGAILFAIELWLNILMLSTMPSTLSLAPGAIPERF